MYFCLFLVIRKYSSLQHMINYITYRVWDIRTTKVEHVSTQAYWHNGFLHTAQVPHAISYPGLAAVWGDRKKQRLHNRAKKSERQSDWNKFKLGRKQLHKNVNRSRSKYLSDPLDSKSKTRRLSGHTLKNEEKRAQVFKTLKLEIMCLLAES